MLHPGSLPVGAVVDEPHRIVSEGDTRLAVIGHCFAETHQLYDSLRYVRGERWVELTKWPGSYWSVAQHGDTTAVITDVAGTRPVYMADTDAHGACWSLSARSLAERLEARYDYATLSARLLCPTIPEVAGDGTAFEGVRRVPGGHALVIRGNGTYTVTPYESARQLSSEDASQELRDALVTAVHARMRSARKPTADFSGGLDSTSLALLAADLGFEELLAVTHADDTSRNDDVEYAQRAAAGCSRLDHALITDTEGLFFSALLDAPPTDQPFPDAARWRMRAAYQHICVERGSDLHLTGSGADTLLSASPYYLADYARERDIAALLRHSLARARLRHLPFYAVVAGAVRLSRTTHAQALRRLAYDIATSPAETRPDPPARLHWVRAAGVCAWLTPDARRHLARRATQAAETCMIEARGTSRHRAWAELREFGTYEAELRIQAQAMGIPHHAPFLDNAVVRAAMTVPVTARASTTRQKPLLGAALDGLVPAWLLARRTKGAYDGNAYTGLRRNAEVLRDLLKGSRLAAEGWIDAGAAVVELDRLAAGVPGRLAPLEALITTELWLHQHSTMKPPHHSGPEATHE